MAESTRACIETSTELYNLIANTKIFKVQELRLLGIKRQHFEHGIKMFSNAEAEEQYVRYISYDMDLIGVIKLRKQTAREEIEENERHRVDPTRQMMHEKRMEMIDKIILMIGNNVNHLFKGLVERFPKNFKHWTWYLSFCREQKMHKASYDLCERLVKVHADKPFAFAYAAEWTLMRDHNYEYARTYLLHGLQLHKDSHDLYMELLRNELEYADMLREYYANKVLDKADDLRDGLMKGEICKVVYEDAKTTLGISSKTVPVFKRMLELMKLYAFTQEYQQEIISDVLKKLPKCEAFHDLIAKAHLVTKLDPTQSSTPYPMEEIERCYNEYGEIIKKCDTETMWSLRLSFVDDMMKQTSSVESGNEIKRWYLQIAEEAHEKRKLSVDQYITWMFILDADNQGDVLADIQNHVLTTPRLNKSSDIWICVFKSKIAMAAPDTELFELFNKGAAVLEKNSLPLFLTALTYFTEKDREITQRIYEMGIRDFCAYPEICITLRVKYLERVVLSSDVAQGRKFYESVCNDPPFSQDLHRLMYRLEWSAGELTEEVRERMKKILERAVTQFGRESIDVWVDRIRHDMRHNGGAQKHELMSRARNYLKDKVELLVQLDKQLIVIMGEESQNEEPLISNLMPVESSRRRTPGTGTHSLHSEYNSILGGHASHTSTYFSPGGMSGQPQGYSSVRTTDSTDV